MLDPLESQLMKRQSSIASIKRFCGFVCTEALQNAGLPLFGSHWCTELVRHQIALHDARKARREMSQERSRRRGQEWITAKATHSGELIQRSPNFVKEVVILRHIAKKIKPSKPGGSRNLPSAYDGSICPLCLEQRL